MREGKEDCMSRKKRKVRKARATATVTAVAVAVAVVLSPGTQKRNGDCRPEEDKPEELVLVYTHSRDKRRERAEPRRGNGEDSERVKANAHRSSVAGLPAHCPLIIPHSPASLSYVFHLHLASRRISCAAVLARFPYARRVRFAFPINAPLMLLVCVFVLRQIVSP